MTNPSHSVKTLLALVAILAAVPSVQAATINFSSVETALAEPDDKDAMMRAAWTSWTTQVYEYNMPFIEIDNTDDAAIMRFTMTIGDSDYEFSNEFRNKNFTNSFPFAANGEYAVTGFSTPDVAFTTSLADGGETLIIDFGDGGLLPGEVVRFQVDINPSASAPDALMFANYTEVFFNNGQGPNGEENNSIVTLDYADDSLPAVAVLPDTLIANDISQFFDTTRPHNVMQQIPLFPDLTVDQIPEPTAAVLALMATACAMRRRAS